MATQQEIDEAQRGLLGMAQQAAAAAAGAMGANAPPPQVEVKIPLSVKIAGGIVVVSIAALAIANIVQKGVRR